MPQLQIEQNKHISVFSQVSSDSKYRVLLKTTRRPATEKQYQMELVVGKKREILINADCLRNTELR